MSIDLLRELVSRYSPSTQEREAVSYLVEWMSVHGFEAWIDEAGNACGLRGDPSAPQTLMLLGHIDTVAGYIEPRLEGDCLYGRGTVDAKGPLAAFASAAAAASIPDGWRIIVVGAVEEESATSKGARHIRDQFAPDLCIIGEPSGVDQITLGYKGRLLIEYRIEQTTRHTATPEPTVGALAAEFWQRVQQWSDEANTGTIRFFDQVLPSLRAINTSSDDFMESAQVEIGLRLPLSYPPEKVRTEITRLSQSSANLSFRGDERAYLCDKNSPLAKIMLKAIRSQGLRPNYVLKTGTSDMNVVGAVWQCPMIAYGPGDSSLDHTPNEHISLGEYEQAILVLRSLIESLE